VRVICEKYQLRREAKFSSRYVEFPRTNTLAMGKKQKKLRIGKKYLNQLDILLPLVIKMVQSKY
jgi:hypothetical protein